MAVEYTIKAHPTTYRGTRFRSRLEATWAAFFDLLEWQWQYEPFDMGKWSPDFLIKGADRNALVEVKPTTIPDMDVIRKISEAGGDHYLFSVGVAPVRSQIISGHFENALPSSCCGMARMGCWSPRYFISLDGRYDIVFGHGDNHPGFVTGIDVSNCDGVEIDNFVGDDIDALWAKAKNTVQWRPR